jgi:HlyD family secretion protein
MALVLAAVSVWVMSSREAGVQVTTGFVTRVESLTATVTASGEIVAARYADIGSPIMGRLISLNAREGDAVRAGAVLARIDPVQAAATAAAAAAGLSAIEADAQAALTQVRTGEAMLDETRARAEEAATAFTRANQLRDAGLLAAADFDRAKSAADAAQAQQVAAPAS